VPRIRSGRLLEGWWTIVDRDHPHIAGARREGDRRAQSGPWNTTVYVLGNRARPAGLKIVLKDHASGGVRVSWLNEKLLFLSGWRGRIASTDLILDIETSKYVYVEDADDGTLILPCAVKVKMPK
jgi:hypothetical protein